MLILLAKADYTHPEPTPAQIAAGNYAKRVICWRGLEIAIENERGSTRRGVKPDGTPWSTRMRNAYGYAKASTGVDGDEVDVFLGPEMDASTVYVIHQRKIGDWDAYDEDKCMVGFASEEAARQAFLANYGDPRFLGPITAMPAETFVEKVKATKDRPAMIKSVVLLIKGHVGSYVRGGKVVQGYDNGRASGHVSQENQGDLFGAPTPAAEPISRAAIAADTARAQAARAAHEEREARLRAREQVRQHQTAKKVAKAAQDRSTALGLTDFLEQLPPAQRAAAEKHLGATVSFNGIKSSRASLIHEWVQHGAQASSLQAKPTLQSTSGLHLPLNSHADAYAKHLIGARDRVPQRKHYATVVRNAGTPRQRVGWLAGPFEGEDEARAHLPAAKAKARELDSWTDFDAFGTASREARHHPPGVLNRHLGL